MSPEDLLLHEGPVRGVARAVLQGDARVDDVVQETWLASLRSGPRDLGAERGWLARVARRFALMVRRGDASRGRRETLSSRTEAVPSTSQIAEREEVRRRVLDAVMALDEPFRAAVLLRYYEDLPPREIAQRLGIPVETARSRVRRGLERLRGRLVDDASESDRRRLVGWVSASSPLTAAPLLGGLLMGKKSLVGAGVLLLLVGTGGVLIVRGGDRPGPVGDGPRAAPTPVLPAPTLASSEGLGSPPPGVEPVPPKTEVASAAPGSPSLLRGRLDGFDPRLPGAARVTVRGLGFRGEDPDLVPEAAGSQDGAFLVDVAPLLSGTPRAYELDVRVDHPAYAPAFARLPVGPSHPGLDRELRILLRRAAVVTGVVVDAAGAPVDGAVAGLVSSEGEDPATLDAVRTGADGRFRLRAAGDGVPLLAVDAPGLRPAWRRVRVTVGSEHPAGPVVLERGAEIAGTARAPQLAGVALGVRAYLREGDSSIHVRDATGGTLASLTWIGDRLERYEARSAVGADGGFRCTGLAPAAHGLRLEMEEGAAGGVRVHQSVFTDPIVVAPAKDVGLDLAGSFLVLDVATSDGPLARASVEILGRSDEEEEMTGILGATTNAAGRVTVLVRPGATYVVSVDHPGLRRVERSIRAPALGGTHEDRLVLEPPAPPERALSVRLLAPDGSEAPVERAEFSLRRLPGGGEPEGEAWSGLLRREGGRFLLEDPPAGRHRLVAETASLWLGETPPYLSTDDLVTVGEQGTTEVTVRLGLGGWLVLSAAAPDGRLLPAECRVLDERGESRARLFLVRNPGGSMGSPTTLSEEGIAHVEPPLPAGRYVVELSMEGYADERVEAVLRAGEPTTVHVPMRATSAAGR